MIRRTVLIICMLLLSETNFLRIYPVIAATYYVSPDGNDGNNGSEEDPFRTIFKAAALVKEGDIVYIKPGTYFGGINITKSGTESAPIIFRKYGHGEVIISGRIEQKKGLKLAKLCQYTYEMRENDNVVAVAIDIDTTKLVIFGLERVKSIQETESRPYRYYYDESEKKLYIRVRDVNPEKYHTIHSFYDATGISITGSNIVLDGFTIKLFGSSGIYIGRNSRNVIIRNCKIYLCGIEWNGGITLDNCSSVKIINCIIYRVMNGIILSGSYNTEILHTTIYRTRAHGILMNNAVDTIIKNNIIFAGGPSGSAVYVYKNSIKGLVMDYNCYLDYATATLIYWGPTDTNCSTFWDYKAVAKTQDVHSISDDPMFVLTVQGKEDFNLQPGSPCIGKAESGLNIGATPAR